MPVKSSKIIAESRQVKEVQSSRTYSMRWQIENDSLTDNWQPLVLLGARTVGPDPLPSIDDVWSWGAIDTTAICKSITLSQDTRSQPTIWMADVEFAQPPPPNEQDQNPLQRRTRFRTGTIQEPKPVTQDKDNNQLRNAAGDEFIDTIQLEQFFPTIEMVKNINSVQTILNWNIEYTTPWQAVNSATFFNGPPRTVKFLPITHSDLRHENNVDYYEATFRFQFNPGTWDEKIVNQGFYFLQGGNRKRAVDDDGQPTSTPVLLETNGSQVPTGNAGNAIDFRVRPELDFNKLAREAELF